MQDSHFLHNVTTVFPEYENQKRKKKHFKIRRGLRKPHDQNASEKNNLLFKKIQLWFFNF